MKSIFIRTVSENTWIFPTDTVGVPCHTATLHAARGGNVLFYILTDETVDDSSPFALSVTGGNGVSVRPYQLRPVSVKKNSAPRGKMGCTEDYESVRDFVTAKAPFDVFDITEDVDATLSSGRLALAVRLTVATDAPVGAQAIALGFRVGEMTFTADVSLTVHKAVIPPVADSELIVCNWIYPHHIATCHGVELYSEDYYRLFREYLAHLLDMRSNHFSMMGPRNYPVGGVPLRGGDGRITDFDFTEYEKMLRIADEMGFTALYGPYIAHWETWTDTTLRLLWDPETDVTSAEAYRQIAIYCRRLREMIERNGWQKKYVQPLVDEPQVNTEIPYRVLAAIWRRFMPEYPVHDPIETTDVGGGPDIWCVKQASYEKHIDSYRAYQAMGEKMTFYTCGYPAGDHMNRVLDLPLTVGRLSFWMCHRYGFYGFLHWGYHVAANREETLFVGPAGNQNIVYPTRDGVAETVRSHAQRAGAEDWELFRLLYQRAPEEAAALIERGCRSFTDYERDGVAVDAIRCELLTRLDALL